MISSEDLAGESTLGILGGLGPEATVSFMSEVIRLTPAERDQDHIEMIVYNDPKVPDRNYPERRDGDGPLPRLTRNARRLERAGADLIVIPSNTTHRYHADIDESVDVPVPHMVSILGDHLAATEMDHVGVLTTKTAADIGLFESALAEPGIDVTYPGDMDGVMEAIYAFKRGEKATAKRMLETFVDELTAAGVDAVVLGCTEFSALEWTRGIEPIDTASVLATRCVELCHE